MKFRLRIWRQQDEKTERRIRRLRDRYIRRTHFVSRDARHPERAPDRTKARNRSRSTPIVAREFAERARSRSTAKRTDRGIRARPASSSCVVSGMARRSRLNHSARNHFCSSRIWWSIAARLIASCRPVASSPRAPVPRRKRIRFRFRNTTPISPWKRRRASVAAPARPRARTRRRCCSLRESFASRAPATGRTGTNQARPQNGAAMDAEGFGNCTNTYECEAVCPAEISASFIAKLNREYGAALLRRRLGE